MMNVVIDRRLELLSSERCWTWNLEGRRLDARDQELTLQQSLMIQEVPKLNPFKNYYVLHFIFTVQILVLLFFFELFRLHVSTSFVLLCLCHDLSIMNDSWLGVHCLFNFFATMHNAHCVNWDLWLINVSVWRKLHHQLGVWSLNYHCYDSHGVGELLTIDFLVLNHKMFLNWSLVH
jgi:hypothetical protein